MTSDRHGLPTTGSTDAVSAYDQAIEHLVRFQIEVVDATVASITADPGFAMGHVLSTYLSLMSTDGSDVGRARETLRVLRTHTDETALLPRERAHLVAADRWASGDLLGAGRQLDEISLEHPRDLLALAVGHQIDFLTGNAVNLRDRIARALGAWGPDDPHFGFLLGMHAFGLEECNRYDLSEDVAGRAVEQHADDVWAIHALVHTYEMRGRVPEGVRFLRERESDWMVGNFLNVHNAWHFALFLLEANDPVGALGIYDRVLHHDESEDIALELVDATSLLWRLHLEGVHVGSRWQALSDAWARSLVPGYYPFNDMHATMAFVGAGDSDRIADLLASLADVTARDVGSSGTAMTLSVGRPVCRGIAAFAEGDYDHVLAELLPVRHRLHEFGGSHAQRDAVARTLLEAAIRGGRDDLARALVGERLAVRESSAYTWSKRALIPRADPHEPTPDAARSRAEALATAARAAAS